MKLDAHPPTTATESPTFDFLNPIEVIDAMIELRIQLVQLQQQIQDLEPAFFAACLMLNQARTARERAIISRKVTAAQWTYDADVLAQEALFKQLRKQFQQDHEPTGGRDITWMIRLLLAQST